MKNWGEDGHEGVTTTWDKLQNEVSAKMIFRDMSSIILLDLSLMRFVNWRIEPLNIITMEAVGANTIQWLLVVDCLACHHGSPTSLDSKTSSYGNMNLQIPKMQIGQILKIARFRKI